MVFVRFYFVKITDAWMKLWVPKETAFREPLAPDMEVRAKYRWQFASAGEILNVEKVSQEEWGAYQRIINCARSGMPRVVFGYFPTAEFACRYADMLTLFFWKHRRSWFRPPDDRELNLCYAQAKQDSEEEWFKQAIELQNQYLIEHKEIPNDDVVEFIHSRRTKIKELQQLIHDLKTKGKPLIRQPDGSYNF